MSTSSSYVVFTVSLPKLRLDALSVNFGLATAVPVPLRATAAVATRGRVAADGKLSRLRLLSRSD